MEIYELSSIATAIDINPKYGTIIGKAAAEYGVTTVDLAEQISQTIKSMDIAEAAKAANWYFDAHNFAQSLATEFNTTVEIVAGIISAVSPRMAWLRNKMVARDILRFAGNYADLSAIDAAKEMGLGLSTNIAMAIKIMRGAWIETTLTGIKRRSFYNNIVNPHSSQSVTVDTWMQMVYSNVTGRPKSDGLKFVTANEKALNGTGAGYFLIADAVRLVANEMGLMPHQIQALYWCQVSGSYNGGRERYLLTA